jgi:hypothetical protein
VRERCIRDPNYFDQLYRVVSEKYPDALRNRDFDYNFIDFMTRTGRKRRAEPLNLAMPKAQRIAMNKGQSVQRSQHPAGARETPSNRSHPDYQPVAKTVSRTPLPPSKGKGKGQWQGNDGWWQRNDGWYSGWRGNSSW